MPSGPEAPDERATLTLRWREATVDLVRHLADADRDDTPLRNGYSSLFVYARIALGLSEHDAFTLAAAARTARRFPVILDRLAEGALHVTAVKLLGPHLTADNHRELLEQARGRSRREIEEIVAGLQPAPECPPRLERLLSPGAVPAGRDRYRVQLAIDGKAAEKLRLARDMLRHAEPAGNDAAIFDRALTALLEALAQKKFAATEAPRVARASAPGSRHIPAHVKRAVWLRDLGRCAFVSARGRRCDERAFLEFHHVHPHAAGGEATVDNIELRCRPHNDYEARAAFGPAAF